MKLLTILLCLLLLSGTAFAQQDSAAQSTQVITPDSDSDVEDLGVVEVEATALPPPEEPAPSAPPTLQTLVDQLGASTAVTAVSGAAVRDSGSAADALERVAGADIRRSGGSGQLDTVMLRGARAQQVLVLLDGAPLMPGQAADLALLPAGDVERVEVLRGPEAARFGAGALGGVLNVITRSDPDHAGQLSTRAGGHGLYESDISGKADEWDWHASEFSARNNYSFTRQSGGTAVRQNDDA